MGMEFMIKGENTKSGLFMFYDTNPLLDMLLCVMFYGALPLIGFEAFRRAEKGIFGIFLGALAMAPLLLSVLSMPCGGVVWVIFPFVSSLALYLLFRSSSRSE